MTAKPIVIQNWSTCYRDTDPFRAPELRGLAVQGWTDNDPRKPGKTPIVTSPVVSVDGRTFRTRSGTLYALGRIDPKFRRWLRMEGRKYDPARPIAVVEKLTPPRAEASK